MKRTPDSIEQCLNQLETVGNDELMLFMDLDPTYYTIRHLLEVRETWVEQVHLFQRSNSVKNLLGFSTGAWILISSLCYYMSIESYVFVICLFVTAIFSFLFCFSVFAIRSKFKSQSHLDNIGRLINMELEKRGVKIPHYDY